MSDAHAIRICEIFGPTIQGEGALIGLPTVFVRTGGCDYRCRWCDTAYAVDRSYSNQWMEISAEEIFAEIGRLCGGQPLMISLSGGNPALQPLDGLIRLGKASGYRFAMETQGSVVQPWFMELAVLTLSPKPPSSGMKTDWRKLQECIDVAGRADLSLKIVVEDDTDYQFAREVSGKFPGIPVYLQPCNNIPVVGVEENITESLAGIERLRWLVTRVLTDAWYEVRVLPQLHVLLWGNKRGR